MVEYPYDHEPTPKQKENWNNFGLEEYRQLSTKAKKWYTRLYRPKKRGDGMMERDEVKFGTPEHYLRKVIEDWKQPMGSMQGLVMASMGVDDEKREELDQIGFEILKAQVSDAQLEQIAKQTERVAELYGVSDR